MGNFSSWKKVLLVAIATFTLIALIFFVWSRSEKPTHSPIETLVDDTVRDLLQDASTEQQVLDEEGEAALLGTEDVLPQDIGESADEK
jgi:uncharacterized protein YpmS